jgi:endoglucanase
MRDLSLSITNIFNCQPLKETNEMVKTMKTRLKIEVVCALILSISLLAGVSTHAALLPEDQLKFDYAQALEQSFLFYEAQRSGDHLDQYFWRVEWRNPAALDDGQDVGVDLSGGWFDAGDHVKFGLPMAYSATMLGWSLYESREAYDRTGQSLYSKDSLRFILNYFLEAYQEGDPGTPEDDAFYYQVGDPHADHAFWGPPEKMTMPRPAYACTASAPCSEVTAGTAAALAAGSVVFAQEDPGYADLLLEKARRLYLFADTYRSSTGYTAANGFYASFSGFWDELAWGATWLHLATGEGAYLNQAKSAISTAQSAVYWAHSWDNVSNGTNLLLARITGDQAYKDKIEEHLRVWTEELQRTPGGLVFLDQWGSLRYASTTAFLALIYAGQVEDPALAESYRTFALNQINYILGDNPRGASYIVGFGINPPKNPHHRAAHDSPTNNIADPPQNSHELTGALVGGPASPDDFDWQDDRTDFIRNEVATDYNAGYTGALAEIVELAGSEFVPPPEPPTNEPPKDDPPAPGPGPVDQVNTLVTTQSDWGTGYCADVTVTNGGSQAVDWVVIVPVEGTLRDIWNAVGVVSSGELTAEGVSWNNLVHPNSSVEFGFCADRGSASPPNEPPPPDPEPGDPPDEPSPAPTSGGSVSVKLVTQSDWTSGYCVDVHVRNTGTAPVDWVVAFQIEGTVRELWNALYTVEGQTVTAEGLDWNNLVYPDKPVVFGFCANR